MRVEERKTDRHGYGVERDRPTYIFLVMERLVDAGVHMVSPDIARNWSSKRCWLSDVR